MTDTSEHQSTVDRRQLLTRLAVGGGVVVAGAAVGGGTAAAVGSSGWKRETVAFDVACLGETWRDSPFNYAEDDGDFRGAPFAVEGWIYQTGHIPTPGDGFVPSSDGSIGRWLCRGSVLVHAGRTEPHVQSSQEFIFGPISGDNLFAADNISTSGMEGTFNTNQVANRSIIGGTGRYLGVTGIQKQGWDGFNTSSFTDGTGNAPNFRMVFELLLPDP